MLVNVSWEEWLGAYAGVLQSDIEHPVHKRVKKNSFLRKALCVYIYIIYMSTGVDKCRNK